jgi:hypothetical protein
MSTCKTYQLLAIIATLFFTLSLKATKKVIPLGEERTKIAIETLALIGTFAEREFFILISLYKNPKEKAVILGDSDYEDRKLKLLRKIQDKENRKKLHLKQSLLYPKCALRTCLFGTEYLIKIPIRTTLVVFEVTRGILLVSASSAVAISASLTPVPVHEAFVYAMDTFSDLCCYRSDPVENPCCPDSLFDECWDTKSSCEELEEDKEVIRLLEGQIMSEPQGMDRR